MDPTMYDTLLVPTDGSDAAEAAAESALVLARQFDASIHTIHVLKRGDLPADVESEAAAELTDAAEATLSTVADLAADSGVAVTTQVLETTAPVHDAIVDYAIDNTIDGIVMGTHGRTGIGRFIVGSVTERTLRVSPIPVLTVHENTSLDREIETILLPTDGSPTAEIAADRAVALAAATGAALHVVHVVDLTVAWGEGSPLVIDALREEGRQAVDDAVARANDAGVRPVEASVLNGTPVRALLDYADDHAIDLVVMGTHGRTGLNRYLLGSVTERVVRLGDGPVLAISMPDDQ
ncbi:universal stress protein [Halococcus salsus]|uniref:universal stress protein n=1 Tax=Halococcus salsus TaxID=2162894 RepID=UPI001F04DE18|nr:universal stress protein [Halococcus salsus]